MARILDLMSDEREWTTAALAARLGVSRVTIRTLMEILIDRGKVDEHRHDAISHRKFYRIEGATRDLTGLEAEMGAMIRDDTESGNGWPAADPVVVSAMTGMIRCGTMRDRKQVVRVNGRRRR